MEQYAIRTFALDVVLTMHRYGSIRSVLAYRVAPRNQSAINRGLCGMQLGQSRAWHGIGPSSGTECSAFECVNIKPINDENVIQGRLNRGEEACATCLEFRLRQAGAGRQ